MKKNLTSLSSYLTYFSKKRKKKLNQTKKRLAHRFSKLSGENTNSNPCGVIPYAEPLLTYSLCRRKCIKCWHTVNASIFTHHIEQPKRTNEIYIFPTTLYILPMKLYIFFKKNCTYFKENCNKWRKRLRKYLYVWKWKIKIWRIFGRSSLIACNICVNKKKNLYNFTLEWHWKISKFILIFLYHQKKKMSNSFNSLKN